MSLVADLTSSCKAFQPLLKAARERASLHAYLLHGPSASTCFHFARTLATALNCTGDPKPCGACPPCLQSAQGSLAAIRVLRPSGVEIRIDQIRATIDESRYRYASTTTQCFILSPAEAMNDQAANAFLKVLEEPTARTVFLLVSGHPDALLTTIRSRCHPVRLAFPEARELVETRLPASGWPRDLAWLALRLADSAPETVEWAERLSRREVEPPALPPADADAFGLALLDRPDDLRSRLLTPEPLRSDPSVTLPLMFTVSAILTRLLGEQSIEAASEEAYRVAAEAVDRIQTAVPSALREWRSHLREELGKEYEDPLVKQDRDAEAVTRLVVFTWMDQFLRTVLACLDLGQRLALGPPDPLLEGLTANLPTLSGLASLPLHVVGRLTRAVGVTRQHLYANVKPLTLLLQNLFGTVASQPLAPRPDGGGTGKTRSDISPRPS